MAVQEHGENRERRLPRQREDLALAGTSRMGSSFFRWQFAPAQLPVALKHDWSDFGRWVFIDPEGGEVTLMAPSGPHEETSRHAWSFVSSAATALSIQVVPAGGTTWNLPRSRRVEADESFYLGEAALRYRELQHEDGLIAFLDVNLPQLVIEVERSHADAGKPTVYSELGVVKMWRIDAQHWPPLTVEILDLQRAQGVGTVDRSAVLPGLTPRLIVQTLDLARREGVQVIPGVLTDAGIGGQGRRQHGMPLDPAS